MGDFFRNGNIYDHMTQRKPHIALQVNSIRIPILQTISYVIGRLASGKDEETNKDYMWCYGYRCFRSSIVKNSEYKRYKFIDFCEVFGFDVGEKKECGLVPNDELSRFLDTVSKVSRITERIYCEECECILFPEKRSDKEHVNSYNRFSCQNTSCQQYERKIYISHCHTGTVKAC